LASKLAVILAHSTSLCIIFVLLSTANLNMSKLDSAYDIDPLFHKMSKTFDEGGAKGLLLVNLGVSDHGCGIVFDSKEDSLAESTEINSSTENDDESVEDNNEPQEEMKEGMIDIGCLTCKLESQLGGSNVDSLPLVPQLQALRDMFQQLEEEGFVDNSAPKKRVSYRYTIIILSSASFIRSFIYIVLCLDCCSVSNF
jgi:condensin complex subunit 2